MRPVSDLRRYQQSVATYLFEHDSALAVLKMGTGKTVSTLTAIVDLLAEGHIRHALVMAPKRVARITWPTEIMEWAHTKGLRIAVLKGTPAQRLALLQSAHTRDLTLVGIDVAQWLCDELRKLPADHPLFDLLVIDEVSKLRAPGGKRTKAMRTIGPRFKMKWGLTGTPRPKALLNLFAPLRLLTDGKLWGNSHEKFKKAHFYPEDFNGFSWIPLPGHEEPLMAQAAQYCVTVDEKDMPELPALNIIPEFVDLPADVRTEYRRMEVKLFAEIVDDKKVLAATKAAASGKLAQIANGFVYGEGGSDEVTRLHGEKLDWLRDLIDELDGEPIMIVYEFVEDLRALRLMLGRDLPYLGDGVGDAAAARTIERWNRGELPFMALHPASGGHGLNLQHGGARMAWLSPCWDAELWDQTIARLYRSGQTQSVMVHVCMARDTVDELKFARVHERLTAQAAFETYLRKVGKGA